MANKKYTPKPQDYISLLTTAIQRIESRYFQVRSNFDPNGFFRERVFCYELYYQLRMLTDKLPNEQSELYTLINYFKTNNIIWNGEIHKGGNLQFAINNPKHPEALDNEKNKYSKYLFKNPDLIFHQQAFHDYNELVIEVKCSQDKEGIIKDFDTLLFFLNNPVSDIYNYDKGIFVLIGYRFENLLSDKNFSDALDSKLRQSEYPKKDIFILNKVSLEDDAIASHISQFFGLDASI